MRRVSRRSGNVSGDRISAKAMVRIGEVACAFCLVRSTGRRRLVVLDLSTGTSGTTPPIGDSTY